MPITNKANQTFREKSSAIQPGLDLVLTGRLEDELHTRIFASSEIIDEQDFSIFHQIVLGFCHSELEKQFKSNYRDVDLPDANGRTPLLWAAWRGEAQKVRILLELGASSNKVDLEGYSALARAAQSGHLDCVRILIDGGAMVTMTTSWGLEPIHLACQNPLNGLNIVKYLLAHGATAITTTPGAGTPLHFASNRGATSIVKLLLKHGADINARNVSGDSPVMTALQGRHNETTCLLIRMGARLDFQSDDGLNMLHYAAFGGGVRSWEALTEAARDGRLSGISVGTQHEGHVVQQCLVDCRRLRSRGGSGITAEEIDMFQRLLDAVDKNQ